MIPDLAQRTLPNILITGVPGSGKTTMATLLTAELNNKINEQFGTLNKVLFTNLNVGEVISTNKLWTGFDEERNCSIFDTDRLIDLLEGFVPQGGHVVDFHSSDFFPERYFDLVVILRCDNSVLFKRLQGRGYKPEKITENIDAEIHGVSAEEAYESYNKDIIVELDNSQETSMMQNIQVVFEKIRARGLLHKLEASAGQTKH